MRGGIVPPALFSHTRYRKMDKSKYYSVTVYTDGAVYMCDWSTPAYAIASVLRDCPIIQTAYMACIGINNKPFMRPKTAKALAVARATFRAAYPDHSVSW